MARVRQGVIDYTKPVLLQQGFNPVAIAAAGVTDIQNYVAATDRGKLKSLDFMPFFNTAASLSEDNFFTCLVGGKEVVKNQGLAMYSTLTQFGQDKRQQIRVLVSDNQTIQTTLNNNAGVILQGLQTIAHYTDENHEAFLEDFKLKYGLGLKRREFHNVVAVTGANQTVTITAVLPRRQGNIIGVGVSTGSAETDVNDCFYDVRIDGVGIIENVTGLKAMNLSGRDNYLLPVPIHAGATFEFDVFATAALANPVKFDINFFFDN